MIRIPQVRVVDEEGAQLGVMPTPQALAMAQERGYDLVEVAPMASPPVVKFLDFGQYKYELTKRDKENKRRQRSVTFKEVRLTPKIGSGDFETKVHRAIEFLEEGDRIKVTVRFRGRELTHPELGRNMLTRFTEQVKEHGRPSGPRCSRASRCTSRSHRPTSPRARAPQKHPKGDDRRSGRAARRPRQPPCTGSRRTSGSPKRRHDGEAAPAKAPARQRLQPPRRPGTPPGAGGPSGRSGATDRSIDDRPRQRQESEAQVPKIKSHKAAQKRIGATGSGKVIRVKAWRGHHLEIKSSRRTRRYAGKALMKDVHAKQVRRLLPYL